MGPETAQARQSSDEKIPTPWVRFSQMGLRVSSASYSSSFAGKIRMNFSTRFSHPSGGSTASPPIRK